MKTIKDMYEEQFESWTEIKLETDKKLVNEEENMCNHENVHVEFDSEKAKNMTVSEIRKAYPRFFGECPDCKSALIKYASWEHYISGDW